MPTDQPREKAELSLSENSGTVNRAGGEQTFMNMTRQYSCTLTNLLSECDFSVHCVLGTMLSARATEI